jgi:hypothetical protein
MTTYTLEQTWPTPTAQTSAGAIAFWQAEAVLNDQVRERRSRQLVCVARDEQQRIVATSTAVRKFIEQLGFPCFVFRIYVAKNHRRSRLSLQLGDRAYQILQKRFDQGIDPDVQGLYIEIENEILAKTYTEAVVKNPGGGQVVYIGRTRDGLQKRIWYFAGARALPPAQGFSSPSYSG